MDLLSTQFDGVTIPTSGNPGRRIFVGSTDPSVSLPSGASALEVGDLWIPDGGVIPKTRTCKQTSVLTNSTTTLANIVGLSFSVVAGHRYMFHFMGTYQSAATTTGVGFAFSGPAMTNSGFISRVRQAANGTDTLFDATQPNNFTTHAASASVVAANTSYMWEVHGYCTPSADGTIQLRAASEVAASQITVDNVGSGYIIDCG